MSNKRVYYAIQQAALTPNGSTTFGSSQTIHGLQSVGMNTRFNLEQIFELGQLEIYENMEGLPAVEVTMEKCLDGKALIYHLASKNATAPTLNARCNLRTSFAMSIFSDNQDCCSGTPLTQVYCSGMYLSSIGYQFPVEGPSRESITLVGNNKLWITNTGSMTFTGQFDNTDQPANWPPIGVARREHFVWGNTPASGGGNSFTVNPSVLPVDIDGIDASGYNIEQVGGGFAVHVQNIKVSVNLGRDELNELGLKGPYWRFVNFPVEVRCDIEVLTTRGDLVSATEAGTLGDGLNLSDRSIFLACKEGTKINLGSRNKLQTVSYGGGNAGSRGGNATVTYSYVGYNDFTVTHPADPTSALAV